MARRRGGPELEERVRRAARGDAAAARGRPRPGVGPGARAQEALRGKYLYSHEQAESPFVDLVVSLGTGLAGGLLAVALTGLFRWSKWAGAAAVKRAEGDPDDDDPDGRAAERSELAEVLEQARDAARIEAKYGRDTPPTTGGGGGGGAGAAGDPASTAAPALGEHAHSSDDEEDDMDASVKRWLRSLGLGQYIDAVAAFANDMDEAAWISKDQVMLLPMSAAERETLLVAIARLPTPD